MALPSTNIDDLELDKFVEESGVTCIRAVAVAASNTSSPILSNVKDNEKGKFLEDDAGDVAIACVAV